jgi:hypothetical protein
MKRTIAALFLAGIASAAFAQATDPYGPTSPYAEDQDIIVKNGESCPAGYYRSVPSYAWQEGHFEQNGYLCESLYKDHGY